MDAKTFVVTSDGRIFINDIEVSETQPLSSFNLTSEQQAQLDAAVVQLDMALGRV